jgi:hypothetical protein
VIKVRLIDADELLNTYRKWIPQLILPDDEGDKNGIETCIAVLEDAPTILNKKEYDDLLEYKYMYENLCD